MTESLGNQISQHVPRMYRVALRMLADEEAAMDAVQEACVKALAGMGEFNGRSTLATWLHTITVRCASDALRGRQRQPAALGDLPPGEEARLAADDEAASPALAAELKELSGLAVELVCSLPEDCRSSFVLTQLDGYSYDDAARIEGQPRGTIASRVYRAKKMLLEQMNARIDGRTRSW